MRGQKRSTSTEISSSTAACLASAPLTSTERCTMPAASAVMTTAKETTDASCLSGICNRSGDIFCCYMCRCLLCSERGSYGPQHSSAHHRPHWRKAADGESRRHRERNARSLRRQDRRGGGGR